MTGTIIFLTLGQARIQFDIIHKYTVYELEVITSLFNPEQCAGQIIERLQSPPVAFKKLRDSK
jgi:chloramphenicol 3-O phosphotransferase